MLRPHIQSGPLFRSEIIVDIVLTRDTPFRYRPVIQDVRYVGRSQLGHAGCSRPSEVVTSPMPNLEAVIRDVDCLRYPRWLQVKEHR